MPHIVIGRNKSIISTLVAIKNVDNESKQRLLGLNAAITMHRILGPEYQLNPSPVNREITSKDTLGDVQ